MEDESRPEIKSEPKSETTLKTTPEESESGMSESGKKFEAQVNSVVNKVKGIYKSLWGSKKQESSILKVSISYHFQFLVIFQNKSRLLNKI